MTILGFQLIQEIKVHITDMSSVMRKSAFGICEKGADVYGVSYQVRHKTGCTTTEDV